MNTAGEQVSVETLVRLLAEDHLTSSEVYFLLRRLSFSTDSEVWTMLHAYYGHPPEVLREIERRVLMRVSPDGLARVDGYLDGITSDQSNSELTQSEYTNLKTIVNRAVELQIKSKLLRQARPDPAALLAQDDKPKRTSRQPKLASWKGTQQSSASLTPPAKVPTSPQPTTRQRVPRSSNNHLTALTTSPKHSSSDELTDLRLPSSLDANPERLLEEVWLIHQWLIESPHTVHQLLDYMNRRWRLRQDDQIYALDLLYALSVTTRINPRAARSQIMRGLSADLTVSAFRRTCADSFARRVALNDRLLAVLDRLTTAPFERITRIVFGDTPTPDLPARLLVWEALGIIARHPKGVWSIRPAGRVLVATLPPIAIRVEDESVSIPVTVENDWLNVL